MEGRTGGELVLHKGRDGSIIRYIPYDTVQYSIARYRTNRPYGKKKNCEQARILGYGALGQWTALAQQANSS